MSRRGEHVFQRLRDDIVAGTYPPGERLTESRLCAAYDVSRVPVREALKQLEVEGFVDSRAYAGVTVARMNADEAADLFAVRTTIESSTARRCAERFRQAPDDADVQVFGKELTGLVEAGARAFRGSDRSPLAPLNTEFHLSLAAFSGNTSMLSLLRQVAAKIEWLYAMDVDVRGEHSWAEHREIAEAVRAGKAPTASRLMRRHVHNSMHGFLLRHAAREQSAAAH